ncbi:UvrD-helicase domain-containing protein [Acidithiobacillus caldus]|jgi:hypothetical protein|uniref:DNA 3'-5' helicase n=1 Tax=Acidithiobacillus caldus (strain ATCC 51756 / DSM 8584 / KU) TaxID=637389 RepID=A0A059ZUY7_ACICK|nr:UvrD-helicase domain-containing protein [Acidithiobacillus caldus]AIA55430.1 putative DNA helicase [Acidithiobacillus caldus ATCC 51756]MBU2729376.1 AAA family ATPase [Acidithiobacillus caldus]MBU2736011.1 AAA family ATPase [Acidithiobacillus caldus ATCC 51756]MBU2746285.1 AAA family ATPase [Acidithiobacillus caldus]MBU2779145.1 AAA family ATPase [Acidithiobacillus caldus]
MQPNPEQMAILQAIYEGHRHIAVNALAGTGKSTTVRFSVDGGPLQGKAVQYVVFNRKNAEEAKQKLPGFVKVDTAHGLAWNGQHPEGGLIRAAYGNRMHGSLYGHLKNLRDRDFLDYVDSLKDVSITKAQAIFLVQDILRNFCQSPDETITKSHIGSDLAEKISLRMIRRGTERFFDTAMDAAVRMSNALFGMMYDKNGTMQVTHDAYLKIWSLGNPRIPADHILFDEAQDASLPMMEGILKQDAQLVFIGDTHQSIYGWRGAVDAMQELKRRYPDTVVLPLQSSYRFGQAVADAGNVFLTALYEREKTPHEFRAFLKGLGNYDSRVELGDRIAENRSPTAYLFRSNAPLVGAAIAGLDRGKKVYMAGDQAKEIVDFLEAACKFYRGEFTTHPELKFFDSFDELKKYTETREGQNLKFLTSMVENAHGDLRREIELLQRSAFCQDADYVLSTMHRSKGLEFAHVMLDAGVQKPFELDDDGNKPKFGDIVPEVWRLLYVACTRPHETLYLNGLTNVLLANVQELPDAVVAAIHNLDRYAVDAQPRAAWESLEFPPVPAPQWRTIPVAEANLRYRLKPLAEPSAQQRDLALSASTPVRENLGPA